MYFFIVDSWGYMPSSRITGLYDNFIPSFLRNLHTAIHSGCVSFLSHQQCKLVPFSLHPLQHLLFVDFLTVAFWPVWNATSLLFWFAFLWVMLNIFPCVYYPSFCHLWRNVCLVLLSAFWLGYLFFRYWTVRAACIFWRLILSCFIWYYFLPFWGLSFYLA